MKVLMFWIASAILTFGALGASADGVNVNDCGANLTQVDQVIRSRFPNIDANYTRRFVGRWIYSGMQPIELSHSKPFTIMGYRVLVCPRADRRFVVLWAAEKTKAGVLKMDSRNVISISETKMGTLRLERENSAVADNR